MNKRVDCVTFNYDDFFDSALFNVRDTPNLRWRPDDGYGFYCRYALRLVYDYAEYWNPSTSLLLKLHGSINWFPKLGSPRPYPFDGALAWAEQL